MSDVRKETFVEQCGQPADLGAAGGCAEDQRALVDGLLEELADRLAVDQREVLLFETQHRRAPGRVVRVEGVARVPGRLTPKLVTDALLAECEPHLAAERAKGEVIELPHGPLGHAASRAWRLRSELGF